MPASVLWFAVVLAVCGTHPVRAQSAAESRRVDESPAVALEHEVVRIAALSEAAVALWPDFDPRDVPLAVYDGERTFLFRHPAPPEDFAPLEHHEPVAHARRGRHEAVTANTSAEIGGVPTATVMLVPPTADRPLLDVAALAIHEAFHVHQRRHHPSWIANEADLFTYPSDSVPLLVLRRLETEALRRALLAQDADGAACWARTALALRAERHAGMDASHAAYESGTELNEGLATYVEMRAAGRRSVDVPPEEFGPADVRLRAYVTGPALALLLDRFTPDWAASFADDDARTLDSALADALGVGRPCVFSEDVVSAAEQTARDDVDALASERALRLLAFESKPGWRVVVEAGGSGPLWPQGFDPLNVERIDAERVLHGRFVQVGHDAGTLQVLDAEALTTGTASHPLFHGIHRVVVTGLAEPEVVEATDKVTVRAPGLTLEFADARVTRRGEVVTVRVGP